MMKLPLGTAVAAILFILLEPRLAAQQPSFRSSALAVRVDVLVTNGGKPVGGLTAQDFELRDNGITQSITLADAEGMPLNVVLALDTSSSMTGARQADLVAAGRAVIDGLKPVDRVALTTFSHTVSPSIGLTSDMALARGALARLTPNGRTSLMDGAYVALAATLAQPGRSLVIICTDGSDISSWLEPTEVIESAKRSNAVLYAVTSADTRHVAALEDLASVTGGEMVRVTSSRDLGGMFRKILDDFRTRYVLSYTPSGVASGGFHRLEVRVKRRGVTVRSRPGYVGEGAQ